MGDSKGEGGREREREREMSVSEKLEEYQHARIYIYTCMYEHPRLVFRAPSFPSTTQLLCERSIPINSSSYTLFEENKEEETAAVAVVAMMTISSGGLDICA